MRTVPMGTTVRGGRVFPLRLGLTVVALPNLTRDQAIERAAIVTVDSYRIELDLTDGHGGPGDRRFRSVTTVEFEALAGADTDLDLAADVVHRATLNGAAIDVSGYDESTGIALTGLDRHNVVVVDADCRYSNTGEGLHRFVDPVDDEVYLYSQFETADAKRMFACFDQPDLKATFDVTVTAPAHWQVVSNGATTAVEGGAGAAKVHTFATTPRMSTYLVALIAGPYARWDDRYTDEHGEIPWACSAGRRWRSSWTPSGCSPRPSRDSASTTATSGCRTRSASTTSCSCRSSTPARWRTPAR